MSRRQYFVAVVPGSYGTALPSHWRKWPREAQCCRRRPSNLRMALQAAAAMARSVLYIFYDGAHLGMAISPPSWRPALACIINVILRPYVASSSCVDELA